jgi:PilZ domain
MVPESRKHPRRKLQAPVAYQIGAGPRVDAACRDASLGGMFIETTERPAYGTRLKVFVVLPGRKEETTIDAVVRWATAEGMGVQFGVMGARDTAALVELLAAG